MHQVDTKGRRPGGHGGGERMRGGEGRRGKDEMEGRGRVRKNVDIIIKTKWEKKGSGKRREERREGK